MYADEIDRFIHEGFFKTPKSSGGYFVDVGAYDGTTRNRTHFFEKYLGWSGTCVEPNPLIVEKLRHRRPKSAVRQVALSHTTNSSNSDFYAIRGFAASDSGLRDGYPQLDAIRNKIKTGGGEMSVVQVPTVTLNQLLSETPGDPIVDMSLSKERIDYLAIDIPHNHYQILNKCDWNKLPPVTIISINTRPTEAHDVKLLLESNHYVLVTEKSGHQIFAHQNSQVRLLSALVRFKKFVVNLDRRPDRWLAFQKAAKLVKLHDLERFPAADGKLLSSTDADVKLFPPHLRRGAVGCAISHLRLWRRLLKDTTVDFYAVWEDDVEFNDEFESRFQRLLVEQLPPHGQWNIVWLGFTGPELHAGKRLPGPSQLLNTGWEYYGGSWAYLISKRGAKQLVDWLQSGKCNTTIDSWLSTMGPQVFPTLKCSPYLCWTQMGDAPGTDSDIQQDTATIRNSQNSCDSLKASGSLTIGTVDGGEWFGAFIGSLCPEASQVVKLAASQEAAKCDMIVHSLMMGDNRKSFPKAAAAAVGDGAGRRQLSVSVVGEARPVDVVTSDPADLRIHCCLPDHCRPPGNDPQAGSGSGSKSDSVIRCIDAKTNLWYVPQWVTSFWERKNPKHTFSHFLEDAVKKKTQLDSIGDKFCAFLYSNDVPHRNRFFDLLSAYKPVDALGKCRNTDTSKMAAAHQDRHLYGSSGTFYDSAVDKYQGYKFVIAFENTIQTGYVTEKLINPMLCPTKPVIIYLGAPDVGEYFNCKSFIDVSKFPTFEAAVEHVRQVDQSDILYNQIRQEPFMLPEQARAINLDALQSALFIKPPALVSKTPSPGNLELTKSAPKPRPKPEVARVKRAPRAAIARSLNGAPNIETHRGSAIGEGEWTMVSALFDIPTDTGVKASNRSIDFYLEHRFVIELNVPLVMFCDPATYPKIWKLRRAAGLLDRTLFVTMRLRDFPLWTYHDRIVENRRKPPTVYAADHRNTPAFFILTASKFHMVQRAIEMNPFNTKFVAFCDYGIQHVGDGSQAKVSYVQEVFKQRRAKPSFCYIRYLSPRISQDAFQMYSFPDGRCTIAAGFFTGSNELMLALCHAIDKEFRRVVELGRGHAEEQLIATVHSRDPEAFDMFYGDYYELISNYASIRFNADAVLTFFIDQAYEDRNWAWILPACKQLHEAQYDRKTIQLNAVQTVRLFERYTQAATELKQPNLTLRLIQQFQSLTQGSDPAAQPLLAAARARQSKLVLSQPLSDRATIVKRVLKSPKILTLAGFAAGPAAVVTTAVASAAVMGSDTVKIDEKVERERERVGRLLDGPRTVVSESEAAILSAAAWSHVAAVVYINLDTRKDRNEELLSQLKRLRVPAAKIHRFDAIRAQPGSVGCSSSHLAVIKMAEANKWPNVLVLEDDFNFIGDTRLVWQNIAEFFKLHREFDIAQLAWHSNDLKDCDNVVKYARKCTNASGYIIDSRFYERLIARWEATLPLLKQSGQDWLWINDQSWQTLQTRNWFAFFPLLGYQRPSYSDLSNKQADPHGIIPIVNKTHQ